MVIKPKILIVILLIVIVAGVVIAIQQRQGAPTGEELEDPLVVCKEAGENEEECLRDAAVAVNDPILCESIKKAEHVKFECYFEMAILQKDPRFCEKITRKIEYMVGRNVLTISEDQCYWGYSLAYGITDVCDRIVDEEIKSKCEQGVEPMPIL